MVEEADFTWSETEAMPGHTPPRADAVAAPTSEKPTTPELPKHAANAPSNQQSPRSNDQNVHPLKAKDSAMSLHSITGQFKLSGINLSIQPGHLVVVSTLC